MKVKSKTITTDGTNRISALKRLSKPTPMNNNIHQRISAPTIPIVTDARQLLTNRNKPVFDARQLLSRQSSKTINPSIIIRKDIESAEEDYDEEEDDDNQDTVVLKRFKNDRLTSEISDRSFDKKKTTLVSTEPISFIKTISNTSYDRQFQNANIPSSSSDQKVVISFSNDQYRKRPRSPSPTPPPIIRRLNDASIQTTPASSLSRRDLIESPIKRNTISKGSIKQISTSTQSKQISSTNSDAATILITNLQPSVTEDDVIELFSGIGHINEIKTLSRGCVQVIYSKQEHAEEAVTKYHNRLLDGQLMYVSLQQPISYSTKSSKNTTESLKSTSNKISIDPSFIRQALFNPSNNTPNPVQFQVKL